MHNARFGGPSESSYSFFGAPVLAAQADPASVQRMLHRSMAFSGVRWWINPLDAGLVYDIHIWRGCTYDDGGTEVVSILEEDTVLGHSGPWSYDQAVNGDLVAVTIKNIVGVVTNGFQILQKGVS